MGLIIVDDIEKVHRSFTKFITEVRNMECEDSLHFLNLSSLEISHLRNDLIEMFKIIHNIYDPKLLIIFLLFQLTSNGSDSFVNVIL